MMATKKDYIISELWILAWNASVQHASLYRKGAWKDSRDDINEFKNSVISYVSQKLIPKYKKHVDESHHCRNIEDLINYANKVDNGVLGQEGYKYGVAQKLLNLALKYYWCLGEITEPPHCPVDRIVINKTIYRNKINWTQINSRQEYLKVIEAVRSIANSQRCSIAHWELGNYNRR